MGFYSELKMLRNDIALTRDDIVSTNTVSFNSINNLNDQLDAFKFEFQDINSNQQKKIAILENKLEKLQNQAVINKLNETSLAHKKKILDTVTGLETSSIKPLINTINKINENDLPSILSAVQSIEKTDIQPVLDAIKEIPKSDTESILSAIKNMSFADELETANASLLADIKSEINAIVPSNLTNALNTINSAIPSNLSSKLDAITGAIPSDLSSKLDAILSSSCEDDLSNFESAVLTLEQKVATYISEEGFDDSFSTDYEDQIEPLQAAAMALAPWNEDNGFDGSSCDAECTLYFLRFASLYSFMDQNLE